MDFFIQERNWTMAVRGVIKIKTLNHGTKKEMIISRAIMEI